MNGRLLLAVCLLLAAPAATLAQSEPKDAVEYDIFIACPDTNNGLCPVRAWDSSDALGSPAIAVDPDNVDNMVFASLHGAAGQGPENRSRTGQQYTSHTSTNHGASWVDRPYFEPEEIPDGALGEHPGIALDPYGHVFVSSTYSVAQSDDSGASGWEYIIAAQKFGSLDDITSFQDGNYNVDYVGTVHPLNRIAQTWFVYDQVSDNVVLLWHEHPLVEQPTTATDAGDDAAGEARELVRRILDPGAQAPTPAASPAKAAAAPAGAPVQRSTISWVWTSADVGDPYHESDANAISPCSLSTNPVTSEGWLYVGCLVAAGEGAPAWNPDAKPGEIHMFRARPNGGAPEYIGQAPIEGGRPKLGVRSDGRMALMTTDVLRFGNATNIRLDGVFGQYSEEDGQVVWGEPQEYGPQMQIVYANMPLVETNIQDMIYREYSGVIHMIFKRVADWGAQPDDIAYSYKPEYLKAIVAIDEHYGLLEEIDLGIGAQSLRLQDSFLNSEPVSLYNDLSDDFLELPPAPFEFQARPLGDQYQREFYAVGNYGFVDFAELIEVTELRGPAAAGLPNPPPPPNPAPATSSALALGLAGSLSASAIVAVTAATAKRKSTVRAGRRKKT